MKKRSEKGFSVVEGLLVVAVVALLALGGYFVFLRDKKEPASEASATTAPAGSTAAIEEVLTDEAEDESAIDEKYATQDETDMQTADTAAGTIEGAYDNEDF